jgi:uncharacterized protein YPO0396
MDLPNMTYYKHIKNFKRFKDKIYNMSINDLTVFENQLLDQRQEIDEKLEIINEVIRQKENSKRGDVY